jgi:hypothetical protein
MEFLTNVSAFKALFLYLFSLYIYKRVLQKENKLFCLSTHEASE